MKPMINEKIKADPLYHSITRKVSNQLKKEIKTGYNFAALDRDGALFSYHNLPDESMLSKQWAETSGTIQTVAYVHINFTFNEERYIYENWFKLIWGLK